MDGYINEGGQLRSRNGQKYIINKSMRKGIFITKTSAIFSAIIAVILFIISIALTYFFITNGIQSCSNNVGQTYNTDEPVAEVIRFVKNGKPAISEEGDFLTITLPQDNITELTTAPSIFTSPFLADNEKLTFNDGWSPKHYTLLIEPNPIKMVNNGTVTIQLSRDLKFDEMKSIFLDIKNITIHDVSVREFKDVMLSNKRLDIYHYYGQKNESYIIEIRADPIDEVFIELSFTSQMTATLQGIYKTRYMNVTSMETKWMISTQFSPIDARRAFPCIDRPDKKANFSISIIRDEAKSMSLSNMPLSKSTLIRPGFVKDDFETTPPMPTYLVAFVISDLVKSNVTIKDPYKLPIINIWTKSETTGMTKYAHKLTREVLEYFEDYFDIKYQLPKLDLVSVPDFGFGAMENWGLITFRDSSLLVPDKEHKMSSVQHTEYVASIITHEIAHQWLGNLVTPEKWEDLWLKEGFASYLSSLAIDHIYPDWKVEDTFTISEFHNSMEKDSDESSHPIAFEIKTRFDILRIFDSITYSKGPILIRMIKSMVGDKAFQLGIQDYLRKKAFGNINPKELWDTMTSWGHKYGILPKDLQLNKIIDKWIHQPGYPVVRIKRDGKHIIVNQERFMVSGKSESNKFMWFIPITFRTSDMKRRYNDTPNIWLTDETAELKIENVFLNSDNENYTIYLNLLRQGYYRVNYDYKSWVAIHRDFSVMNKVTRAQIIDDAMHLARAEYLNYDIPFTFLLELRNSPNDELLWLAAEQGLKYLINMLQREPAYELFRAFMRYIILPAFNTYGLEEPQDDNHSDLLHRARVASLACKFNYDRCTNSAQLKFRKWIQDPFTKEITPNLKETIYCTAISEGSFQEWYYAYAQYKKTSSASEKELILSSMGCTNKPWLLSKYLNMTLDKRSGILKQDAARAFSSVASNPLGFEIAFDFLATNIKEISEYYGDGFQTVFKMVSSITSYMSKGYHKKQLEILSDNAKELGLTSVVNAVSLAMQTVDNNIYWRKRSYNNINGVLDNLVKDYQINIY